MSLGHWCFGLHCHMFTRFFELTELKHVTVQSFVFELKKLQTEALEDCLNSLNVFLLKQSLTRITVHCRALLHDHCRALWQLWLPQLLEGLSSTQLSLTVVWLTSHWEGSTNWWPIHWECPHWATKVFQPLRCWHQHCQSLRLLRSTTYCWSLKLSLLWGCETLKSTALSQDWLPSTAVPGSMTDGLYGIRYAIPSPDSPCNCFSLAALHSRRCQNWHALKNAETLFPNCKMPHSSYTLAEFNCYGKCGSETVEILTGLALKGDVVTTGQTAQSMCFATSLSTAKKILDTGLIPVELFTNSQVNNWFCPRSALLRSLQIYWSGLTDTLDVQEQMALIIYNPGLERYLTSSTVHGLKSNWIDTEGKIEAYTDFNRLYLDHCWTTGSLQLGVQLNTAESRTGFGILLPFTVKELMEPLQMELNCNKIFGMHCRGLVGHCILTVNQLELMHEDVSTECAWLHLFTDEELPKKTGSRLATAHEETGTAKVDVKITGLPVGSEEVTVTITGHWDWVYPRDLWGNCFWTLLCWLMHWRLGSRFTEDAHLHAAPRLIDTVQLIYRLCFFTDLQV